MNRTFSNLALALLVCAAAPAATVNTTLTVTNATGSIGASITVSGPATLTNIGSGTFSATLSLTPDSSGNYSAPFTITLTGGADKITGTLKLPGAALSGGPLTGASATVTGGSGAYAGAVGSFPALTGSGSFGATGITLSFTGAGTIITGGPVAPTITDVLDAGGYTKNIAQGSIFVVKGTALSASGFTQMSFPLPQSSSGVKITFTPRRAAPASTRIWSIFTTRAVSISLPACCLPGWPWATTMSPSPTEPSARRLPPRWCSANSA